MTPTYRLFLFLLPLLPLGSASTPAFISSDALKDIQIGYQLSSFTNLRSNSKYVDIVLVADDHKSIVTQSFSLNNGSFYAPAGYHYSFEYNANLTDYSIVGTLGADFNNDKFSDLMVVFANDSAYKLAILWNRDDRFSSFTVIGSSFSSPPSLLDYNGDIYPDFICSEGTNRFFYVNDKLKPGTFAPIAIPEEDEFPVNAKTTKVAFGDMNGDCKADLLAITELANGSASIFEYWQANGTAMKRIWQKLIPDVAKSDSYSAPLLTDMDSNGKLDIVVAGCSRLSDIGMCQESKVFTFYNDPCTHGSQGECSLVTVACAPYGFTLSETVNVFEKFVTADKETWGFLGSKGTDLFSSDYLVRPADMDGDGHVDLLTVLKYDKSQVPVILYNVPDNSVPGGRTFQATWMDDLDLPDSLSNYSPWVLTSADVVGTGQEQLFVMGREGDKFGLGYFKLKDTLDTYFLKITVLCPGCLDESVTIIGACTYYETSGYKGDTEVGYGAQNSLLSIGSLQTPYTLYGLGQQANYIEEIVSAYRIGEKTNQFGFDSLVPNSQVFAIPYEDDGRWKLVMLVIPGSALWSTLIVLGACSLVCIVIITGLHIKERKEDDREKRKFNAKFNFDAM